MSDPFSVMSANEDSRLNFANNCIKLVEEMDFDGIDIDWGTSQCANTRSLKGLSYTHNFLVRISRVRGSFGAARRHRKLQSVVATTAGEVRRTWRTQW